MLKKIFKFLFLFTFIVGLISTAAGLIVGMYFYIRLTRDLPKLERISDYRPQAATSIYAADGSLMGELYDKRRYPVKLQEVPKVLQNAFLAAEDANFYHHQGIDFVSILRAVTINLRGGSAKQGASTITQQVVKSLLLSREKTYERKAKEAILSYRIEKALTKDEIFTIYLNEIFLGNTAYGVKAAARVHFRKDLQSLTLAESAFLAGLPKSPSYLIEVKHRTDAKHRRHYVLQQMLKNRMISASEAEQADAEPIRIYPPENQRLRGTEYYFTHAAEVLKHELKKLNKRWTPTDPGGFVVKTNADVQGNRIAIRALQNGLRAIDKRRGWRGPLQTNLPSGKNVGDIQVTIADEEIEPGKIYSAVVSSVARDGSGAEVQVGNFRGTVVFKGSEWARRLIDKEDNVTGVELAKYIKTGQVIEVSLLPQEKQEEGKEVKTPKKEQPSKLLFQLDQTPLLEGAILLQNALTGAVQVVVGGYDYQRSEFNRATQGLRQPGSSFKPFVYLAALDYLHYTPSTIVPDSPISLVAGNGQMWTPGNFDGKFLGPMTLRTALQKSRNVVSVYMITKLGVDRVIETARKLGISTPIGRDMSISLGTSEVTMLDMIRGYGTFAAGGWLADQIVVTSVYDREGKLVLEVKPNQHQVISEESAFIMAHMMKGVVDRGTATAVKKLNRPVAGKTGTTNDEMDAWFIGYTPEWVCGVWIGFDQKRNIGHRETGGKAAAPIFVEFMEQFLADKPVLDFLIPDGVIPELVNVISGRPTSPDDPQAFVEYFKSGTEPEEGMGEDGGIPKDYLSSSDF